MTTQTIDFNLNQNDAQLNVVDNALSVAGSVSSEGISLSPNGTDQRLIVNNTAGGVSFSPFPLGTTQVLLTVETAELRYRFAPNIPTAISGHILAIGEERVWPVDIAESAKFIRTGATSAVIHASPFEKAG